MTTPRAEFAYAQARLQARHALSPDATWWAAAEASRTSAHFLALVRSGPLGAWVEGLDPAADAHRIEQHLSIRWARHVDEVARWLPARWRAAAREFGVLPELARREPPAPAAEAARWLAGWQRLLPRDGLEPALLRRPAEVLLPRLAVPDGVRGAATDGERHALGRLFRRHATTPVAVFAQLALVALDVERLRGGAVLRALFAPRPNEAA